MLSEFGQWEHRLAVVDFAHRWVGQESPDVMWSEVYGFAKPRYVPGKRRIHWCWAFVAWCYQTILDAPWPVRLYRGISQWPLPQTSDPLPGDCAIYNRPGSGQWHHAIVDYDPDPDDGKVPTIDGNGGPAPGRVVLACRPKADALYYVSIQPLLEKL
jgi:hypothetical protein